MKFPIMSPRSIFRRGTFKDDAMAGLVLGVESVPDGLANGLLAGVNPLAGLYAYLYGMAGATLFTSTTFMAVQGTGAMSIIVADVDLASKNDPARSLFTLAILTGVVMIVVGLLRLGSALRFVSNSVMTGFVGAVGVNIVLGQLDNFTGYKPDGPNRLVRAFDLLIHPGGIQLATLVVGVVTVGLILLLQKTKLDALGLVVAIVVGSAVAAVAGKLGYDVAVVGDVADVPSSLPLPVLPVLGDIPTLIVPALSLAFVGLVQGAGVSAGFPNREGERTHASQDFVGQGAGNVVAGLFQGMPVGGSMSGTSLVVQAGARSRASLLYACGVMALVIVFLAPVVERVAMPALAGLLIVVGVGTVRPSKLLAVARTGTVPLVVMIITFVLTIIVPLQYAVLVGVGISVILFVIMQSSRLVTRRILIREDGTAVETSPPNTLPRSEVVIVQPYGAIFFATAAALFDRMPQVGPESHGSVVILRIRGADEAGATLLDVLKKYALSLNEAGNKLVVVTDNEQLIEQLRLGGILDVLGADNVYRGTANIGEALRRAHSEAQDWVRQQAAQRNDFREDRAELPPDEQDP
ncbi:SulP family inorganic anion transporter [Rhodococcus sp. H29-C3]|uniref:SulP family inorganic anion transporter n=1 Tax=Rhodococcus sp. H29-C3 TaxID=3046307 RepID=UPI0024BA59E4|nr:SulP family inorganic anion transporter [Rhodococcus sp. H29-C3]MDJ0359044.1 SulP family inorganic anion transporter [Rhodococcus sp. H29-C3]